MTIIYGSLAHDDRALARFLGQHYGDRSVYLDREGDELLLEEAIRLGLVSEEGYLTRAGYEHWASQ
ncbi:MAG: hypothetical protein OES46_16620 [Gammaproteobacteria bacterium]|nr:hypothetical protein [Gammaproteobacteria bacterium]